MDIAAYGWYDVASSHVRVYQPMLELQRHGHNVVIFSDFGDLEGPLPDCEVAYLARYHQHEARRLVERLQAAGTAVVWDCDDDLVSHSRDGDAEQRARLAQTVEMVRLADLVTTTNDRLGDIYLAEGARAVVSIPNYLARPNVEARREPHEGLVLGWISWIDHQRDWDALGLEEVVRELLERHDDVVMECVGPVDLRLPPERYVQRPTMLFDKLGPAIARFDIGIAPLAADFAANHARSDIKLKEYAIAQVPWLASPVGPYAGYGEEQGGRLVADDEWLAALDALVRDRKARRKLAKNGHRWARQHTLAANVHVWEDMLYEAIELAAERRGAGV